MFVKICGGSLQSQGGVPVCTECLGTDTKNRLGAPEALISCHQCKSYAHPSCLDILEYTTQSIIKVKLYRYNGILMFSYFDL